MILKIIKKMQIKESDPDSTDNDTDVWEAHEPIERAFELPPSVQIAFDSATIESVPSPRPILGRKFLSKESEEPFYYPPPSVRGRGKRAPVLSSISIVRRSSRNKNNNNLQ
jgi:hypothetical protein